MLKKRNRVRIFLQDTVHDLPKAEPNGYSAGRPVGPNAGLA